jgi:hypothetical protein
MRFAKCDELTTLLYHDLHRLASGLLCGERQGHPLSPTDLVRTIDPCEAQVVELRFFVGLSNEEIADRLGVCTRSVARDWLHAKAWLRCELASTDGCTNAA